MRLIDFLNENENWEELLSVEPYWLKIKRDGLYVLFKYSQLNSDFRLREVQEARGSIFKFVDGRAQYVCRPFAKFFNVGEINAADIDWSTAQVREKVDGSLMKIWFDNGDWHLSTNGTIDAFKAKIEVLDGYKDFTFGELFERALGRSFKELAQFLDKRKTYLFELVSLDNKVVISYEKEGVYLLAAFDTDSGVEEKNLDLFKDLEGFNLNFPKVYNLSSIEDTLDFVCSSKEMEDKEGVVVNDAFGNRVKVKTQEYLLKSKIFAQKMTKKRLIEFVLEEKVDDLLAYFPEYTENVGQIVNDLINLSERMENIWEEVWNKFLLTNKEKVDFALLAKESFCSNFLFRKFSNKELKAIDYLKAQRVEGILKLLEA